jgi:hypothetical protein
MRLRSRLAIVTITAALTAGMLTALGVAVPVSAAARAQVTPRTYEPYEFESVGNLNDYITGDTHGEDLHLSTGTAYYTENTYWVEIRANSAGTLCWNAVPKATSPVGIDSCQGTDQNELWYVDYCHCAADYYILVQEATGDYATAVDGKIDLDTGGGPPGNYEWYEYPPADNSHADHMHNGS